MTFTFGEIDTAMRVYLGGPLDSESIQLGAKSERLAEHDPDRHNELQLILDLILDTATNWALNKTTEDRDSLDEWLVKELPGLSRTTRVKIANHVIYFLVH